MDKMVMNLVGNSIKFIYNYMCANWYLWKTILINYWWYGGEVHHKPKHLSECVQARSGTSDNKLTGNGSTKPDHNVHTNVLRLPVSGFNCRQHETLWWDTNTCLRRAPAFCVAQNPTASRSPHALEARWTACFSFHYTHHNTAVHCCKWFQMKRLP